MAVKSVLEKCDPARLDLWRDTEQNDYMEASRMVPYLIDNRRIQKILWRQLFVLDSMMTLLEGLESSQQLLSETSPPKPDRNARARWKALKAETKAGVEETEALIGVLQGQVEQINNKRQKLTWLVKELEAKKEKSERLQMSLQKAQNALHVSEDQLTQLIAQSDAMLDCLGKWQLLRDELLTYLSATKEVMQTNLLSLNSSEMSLEQKPRPCGNQCSNVLQPLKLSVKWEGDNSFRLQINQDTAGMVEESMRGHMSELSAALLEVMQRYTSQGDMLAEIQALYSSFAIDWRPAERLLIFLKSASVVCSLEVEEGYPTTGQAKLLSIRRDNQPLDITTLQPPKANMSLTEWLIFLHCDSVI